MDLEEEERLRASKWQTPWCFSLKAAPSPSPTRAVASCRTAARRSRSRRRGGCSSARRATGGSLPSKRSAATARATRSGAWRPPQTPASKMPPAFWKFMSASSAASSSPSARPWVATWGGTGWPSLKVDSWRGRRPAAGTIGERCCWTWIFRHWRMIGLGLKNLAVMDKTISARWSN